MEQQLDHILESSEVRSLHRSEDYEVVARTVLGSEAYEQSLAWAAGIIASHMIVNMNLVGSPSVEQNQTLA